MSVKVVTASASLIMMSIVAVEANQGKFDTRVQKAATDIAAAQLGSMRGPIDYDEVPVIVKSKPTIKSKVESEIFQRPAWMPESEDNKLPPITNHVDGVDSMATGSIKNRQQPRALPELWDRFDESGNPVDRYGNRID